VPCHFGFCREIKNIIDKINDKHKQYEFICCYDYAFEKNTKINGFPILGSIDDVNLIDFELALVIAVGNPKTKKNILNKLKRNNIFIALVKIYSFV